MFFFTKLIFKKVLNSASLISQIIQFLSGVRVCIFQFIGNFLINKIVQFSPLIFNTKFNILSFITHTIHRISLFLLILKKFIKALSNSLQQLQAISAPFLNVIRHYSSILLNNIKKINKNEELAAKLPPINYQDIGIKQLYRGQ